MHSVGNSRPRAGLWLRVFPAVALLCSIVPHAAAAEEHWILIETGNQSLSVMLGEEPVHRFENVSIGRNGTTSNKITLDQKTPLGSFRIADIRKSDRYYRFIALDYPDLSYARRALVDGVIDDEAYAAILSAHEQGVQPPASTPLGGHIGIHGIGDGDLAIHQEFNWTEGCVALTNEEIDELLRWATPRMVVVIL